MSKLNIEVSEITLPKSKYRLCDRTVSVYSADGQSESTREDLAVMVLFSNNYETMNKMFLKTLYNLKEINLCTTISLNLQGYTYHQVVDVIEKVVAQGFKVNVIRCEYDTEEGIPLCRMFDDTCKVYVPKGGIYIRLDDDFLFKGPSQAVTKSAGQQYLDILNYMSNHYRCGVVNTFGTSLCKYPGKYKIGPSETMYNRKYYADMCYTGKGLFLRDLSGTGQLVPIEYLEEDYLTPNEEILAAANITSKGFYIAKCTHVRINHVYQHSSKYKDPEYVDEYNWRDYEYIDKTLGSYIRDNYNPNYKFHEGSYNIVSPDTYLSNRGCYDLFNNKELLRELIEDYERKEELNE